MLCALFIRDFWVFSEISLRTHQIISSGLRTVNSNLTHSPAPRPHLRAGWKGPLRVTPELLGCNSGP